ncbi:protoporphyrinogen oxidase [Candidatus Cerribacteria bacterium 'Amazon FNV 2010 28 9']|uniref:Protoporphyrinogen oxidase n=1 Tax=Candidatus Cerribacteria bacterium 'Amazon FNV 2010 28 9' TaxID=2081795 RepID=A0A317JSJ8_9BACT|nr:MAG: protoporphyrinogen oxidase [Candidatus Cerribacteria bacterium 'Amazon FNV 2010 28 9']
MSMKILIVYGTTEGQTAKISHFIGGTLKDGGHEVTVADASQTPPSPALYDAVIIGASIHMHRYQSAVLHYITSHIETLRKMPGAFFSVCLAIASDFEEEHKEARKIAADFLKHAGWEPVMTTQIAGALKYRQYDFFTRLIMKMIARKEGRTTDSSKDYEYTDWNAVREFAKEFTVRVRIHPVAAGTAEPVRY